MIVSYLTLNFWTFEPECENIQNCDKVFLLSVVLSPVLTVTWCISLYSWHSMDVRGKVCIITGSAQGLGRAFATRLLEGGGKVCISDVNQEKGEDTLAGLRERFGQDKVCFVMCDVTKEEQFVNLFDKTEEFFKVSCVDLLANNAGVNLNFGWRKCMEINIISVMLGTDIALERMRKAGKSGQIINTASMAGFAPGLSEKMAAYTVSKGRLK